MAENYGTLEGELFAYDTLEGDIDNHGEITGEIQFTGAVGGVKDVQVNNESVVDANKVAHIDLTPYAEKKDVYDKQTIDTALKGKADTDDIPTALSQLDNDDNYVQDADYHHTDNNFTNEDKAAIGNIPENITDLSDVAVDNIQNGQVLKWDATQEKFVNADESGGGSGDVADVKVNGTSVVDPTTKEANIDLTGYAEKSDLGTASSKDVPATGNAGANEVVLGNDTRLSDSRPASDVSSWAKADSKPTYQYSEIQNTPSLGTAAAKDFDNSVIDGSSNLVTGDAVHDAIDNAVSGAYKHAGTKTCAELISSLLVKANAGNVYNMTDSGTTTSDFIEGAGLPIRAGDNVGVAKIDENTYKFDLLSGFVDTSNFITKSSTSGLVKNDGSIDTTSYQPTESGKGLSTNDYDNTAKGKVDALGTASTKNVPTSGDAGNNEVVLGNDTRLTDARPASDVSAWAKESTKPSYTKSEVGLGNVDNTSDSTKKTNFTGSIASGDTGFTTGGDVYTALGGKADKVSGATNGNLAGLNSSGNLTDSGWNGAKDTTSASGNPISIPNLKSNQLAVNPIITLEPIQAGSGTPSPVNQRPISGYDKVEVESCGKNILDMPVNRIKLDNSAVAWSDNTYTWNGISFRLLVDNDGYIYGVGIKGTATANTFIRLVNGSAANGFLGMSVTLSGNTAAYYSQGIILGAWISGIGDKTDEGSGVTYTYPSSFVSNNIAISVLSGSVITNEVIIYPMLRDSSQTDDTYEPYHKTTDLSESLGQTVYGATWYPRTGKLLSNMLYISLKGKTASAYGADGISISNVLDRNARGLQGVCSHGVIAETWSWGDNEIYLGYNDKVFYWKNALTLFGMTLAEFNTWLASNDIWVCYEAETPTEIQLTPHEISLLKDYAYVSTNGTSISLDYHNGELASLADVSQLGETVNEGLDCLKDYVEKNNMGTSVDLSPYYDTYHQYVFPTDGYVHVSSESATSGVIRVAVRSGDNKNIAAIYMNVTGNYQIQSLFVRKGMSAFVQNNTATNSFARFHPLV